MSTAAVIQGGSTSILHHSISRAAWRSVVCAGMFSQEAASSWGSGDFSDLTVCQTHAHAMQSTRSRFTEQVRLKLRVKMTAKALNLGALRGLKRWGTLVLKSRQYLPQLTLQQNQASVLLGLAGLFIAALEVLEGRVVRWGH